MFLVLKNIKIDPDSHDSHVTLQLRDIRVPGGCHKPPANTPVL